MISRNPKLRIHYDDRVKAELDQRSALKDAKTEGYALGEARGEKRGEARGLIQLIEALEQILKLPKSDLDELSLMDLPKLRKLATKLQRQAMK